MRRGGARLVGGKRRVRIGREARCGGVQPATAVYTAVQSCFERQASLTQTGSMARKRMHWLHRQTRSRSIAFASSAAPSSPSAGASLAPARRDCQTRWGGALDGLASTPLGAVTARGVAMGAGNNGGSDHGGSGHEDRAQAWHRCCQPAGALCVDPPQPSTK